LSTVQLDFQLAQRFKATYTDDKGSEKNPVIIHRAVYGSLERFIGILTEHYQGKFPLWLSPLQVKVVTISDENVKYAEKILQELLENGIRAEGDFEHGTIGHKIREASLQRIPYTIVIGKKEEEGKTIAVRDREGKTKYKVKLKSFIDEVKKEVESKK
jgi:threonyl-tRNA synthetase